MGNDSDSSEDEREEESKSSKICKFILFIVMILIVAILTAYHCITSLIDYYAYSSWHVILGSLSFLLLAPLSILIFDERVFKCGYKTKKILHSVFMGLATILAITCIIIEACRKEKLYKEIESSMSDEEKNTTTAKEDASDSNETMREEVMMNNTDTDDMDDMERVFYKNHLKTFHSSIAVAALVLYVIAIIIGILVYRTKRAKALRFRFWHILIGLIGYLVGCFSIIYQILSSNYVLNHTPEASISFGILLLILMIYTTIEPVKQMLTLCQRLCGQA